MEKLQIVMVEDSVDDVEIIQFELRNAGFDFAAVVVKDRPGFITALQDVKPDIILSDFSMPSFDGLTALEIAKSIDPYTPFVFVSGTIGEERAIEALKNGATDYILKDHLISLGPKIKRALAEAKERRDKIQAEVELEKSEEVRKLIMNAAMDAIIGMDKNGVVTLWNLQAEKIFGWKEEEVIGKKLLEFILPNTAGDNNVKDFNKNIKKGKLLNKLFELTVLNKQRKEFPVELSIVTIIQAGKEFYCAFIKDVTERKQNEKALMQLNRKLKKRAEELAASNAELEQFAYIASHDLQEPLRMITSFLTQLEKKYQNRLDKKAIQYINFAVDGAVRMRRIILDLLEYSRAGRKAVEFEDIDLDKVLKDVLHLNQTTIDEQHAVIKSDHLPTIFGARTPLQQVLHNLIGNALKYQKPDVKPRINVNVKEEENYWKFSVSDNGIGIEPKHYEKVFIIFQRLHNREDYSGSGLGLAICKKIIQNHNGNIWIESEPGIGSTFHFTISKKLKNEKINELVHV